MIFCDILCNLLYFKVCTHTSHSSSCYMACFQHRTMHLAQRFHLLSVFQLKLLSHLSGSLSKSKSSLNTISILFYPTILEGRRGTTGEFATIPFHLDMFSAALVELARFIPVHSLILSSHLFFWLPLFLFPFTVPCWDYWDFTKKKKKKTVTACNFRNT